MGTIVFVRYRQYEIAALASRSWSGKVTVLAIELLCWCAHTVIHAPAAASANSGSFSVRRSGCLCRQSIRRRIAGSVTTIGFDSSPAVKHAATIAYRAKPGLRTYAAYASSASIQQSALSTSLRSDTQATDSTSNG